MASRKRSAKPIEIALTEEQIEGILAEAAVGTRKGAVAWASVGAHGDAVAEGGSGSPMFPGPSPAGFAPAEPAEIPAEVEEHRRKVIRQLRGWEPRF